MLKQQPFHLQKSISKGDNYCLDVISPKDQTLKIFGIPLAKGDIDIYDTETLGLLSNLKALQADDVISQCKFDTANESLIWSSRHSGKLSLHDLRTGAVALELNALKPILSFDTNASHDAVAAGTELVGVDADIVFWDIRNAPKQVAKFEECHSDDVTQIKFHPNVPTAMMSGSTDGLINLYNLETMDEEEALYQVIKDDSVSKIGYFGPSYEYLYHLTHMETLSIWKFQDADKIRSFGDVRATTPHLNLQYCIDCNYDEQSQLLFLIAGSQEGTIGIFDINLDGLSLVYTLNGGHQDIVRGVNWNIKQDYVVSAAEDGTISTWTH